MKLKITCTITIEYELDEEDLLNNYQCSNIYEALDIDLDHFRDDSSSFFEVESMTPDAEWKFEGEVI